MITMTLSSKRQVVLPAHLCQQIALAPGALVQVELTPSGDGIVVRPSMSLGKKPASVLFNRWIHQGKQAAIEKLQGLSVARTLSSQAS